jgi:hypothetical protein
MTMQGGPGREEEGMESMRTPKMGASELIMYLKGIDFPADKQKLVDMARSKGAPEKVVQWLNMLPNKQYSNTADVEHEFNKMK